MRVSATKLNNKAQKKCPSDRTGRAMTSGLMCSYLHTGYLKRCLLANKPDVIPMRQQMKGDDRLLAEV